MERELQERLLGSGEKEHDLKGRVFQESKKIWKVALPGIISRVTSFGTLVVTQSFIGHIDSVDLAGYALIQTLGVRFINGILVMNNYSYLNYVLPIHKFKIIVMLRYRFKLFSLPLFIFYRYICLFR